MAAERGDRPDWTALREGRFPFALAPEGATNGHGERVGPLESSSASGA